jgi:rhamnosyltransferase subunit B
MTSPAYEQLVVDEGFSFVPFGSFESYQATFEHPDVFKENKGFRVFFGLGVSSYLEAIPKWIENIPPHQTVWIFSNMALNLSAVLARSKHPKVHLVTVYLSPATVLSQRQTWVIGSKIIKWAVPKFLMNLLCWGIEKVYFSDLAEKYARLRCRMGLKKVRHFLLHWHHSSDLYLFLFPQWFESPFKDWPKPSIQADFLLSHVEARDELEQQLSSFLSSGCPPVILTFGSDHRVAGHHYQLCIRVLLEKGFRVVALSRNALNVESHVNLICLSPHINLSRLMSQSLLVIHHGGVGTLAQTIAAGIPQIVIPFAFDQWGNAKSVERLQSGYTIPSQDLSEKKLSKAIEWATDPNTKSRCVMLAEKMKKNAENNDCWLDELAKVLTK